MVGKVPPSPTCTKFVSSFQSYRRARRFIKKFRFNALSSLAIRVAELLQISSEGVRGGSGVEEANCPGCSQCRRLKTSGLVESASLGPEPTWRRSCDCFLEQGGFPCGDTVPGEEFQPGGEQMTSLAEATHLAFSQECWDNFKRWQGRDEGERGLLFRNPVLTAICDI